MRKFASKLFVHTFLLCIVLLSPMPGYSKGLYMENSEFLAKAFAGQDYTPGVVWLKAGVKATVQDILQRKNVGLRVRYWQSGNRTAWVFNETGKELPITTGFVIEDGRILQLYVMEYRESRGGEVRHDFFTRQFLGLSLDNRLRLDSSIDGITGATLSVRSMQRAARAALYLHSHVISQGEN